MRVLIVHPKMYIYGGAELLIVRLANYLTAQGIENGILTTGVLPQIAADLTGTKIIEHAYRSTANWHLDLCKNAWRLVIGVREQMDHYDVINVHNCPAEFSAFLCKKPVVWMCNEPAEVHLGMSRRQDGSIKQNIKNLFLGFERYIVRHYVKNVVVADEFNAARFQRLYGLMPKIIPYGIDHEFFTLGINERRLVADNQFTIVQVGMITPLKNQMASVKIFENVRKIIPQARLILAGYGEGPYFQELCAYIQNNNLHDAIEITGHLERKDLKAIYLRSDVMLHPVKPQGGWLSPFEAICAQVPVIVSAELTAAPLMQNNNLGIVTDDYLQALTDVYTRRREIAKLSRQRAAWVKDNLSWDLFGKNMVSAYMQAIANQKQSMGDH